MEAFLLYQIKVAILIAIFLFGYRLLLGRETFYSFNRVILITIALLSFVLPCCHITRESSFLNDSVVLKQNTEHQTEAVKMDIIEKSPENRANIAMTATIADNDGDIQPSNSETEAAQVFTEDTKPKRDWHIYIASILLGLYGIGVLLVLIKKAISIWSMTRIIKQGRYADRTDGCDIIESDIIPQPVNWMHYIVMPHKWLNQENSSVWKHENHHARKWHSLDLLLTDIISALQWFNPVTILLRKEFELIHEFEADHAVLASGANAREYKLILVNAVATSRGLSMANWLKQSSLKTRIDMMSKKESNGYNRLKALFIPALAYIFLFITANVVAATPDDTATVIDNNFRWPVFEDGKTYIFEDGTARVNTFDGVVANMKVDEIAAYLDTFSGYETTRMTLMYTYPIEGLAHVQPLAEQLNAVGIKTAVANNEEMLSQMTKPEYRTAKIIDTGNGTYRFELVCNSQDNLILHYDTRGVITLPYKNMTITGNLDLMKKWINMFDGHGIAIYPKTMPYSDLQQMAKTAWKRDLNLVTAIISDGSIYNNLITLIPKNSNLSIDYKSNDAVEVINKVNASRSSDHFDKGLHIPNPQTFYISDDENYKVHHVIKTSDQLIIVLKPSMHAGTWWLIDGISIDVNGKIYKSTKYEGINGFENTHFWCPDNGNFYQTYYFDVSIPDDVLTVNIIDDDNDIIVEGLQVSATTVDYSDIRVENIHQLQNLKTTQRPNSNLTDYLTASRIEFSSERTKFYFGLAIYQSHAFMGHISSDITLTLSDSTILKPLEVLGVPTDQEFYRGGDWTITKFQLIFPAIDKEIWDNGVHNLKMTICHEPVTMPFSENFESSLPVQSLAQKIEPGRYIASIFYKKAIERDGGIFVGYVKESDNIQIEIDGNEKMTITDSNSKILPEGKYTLSWNRDLEDLEFEIYSEEELLNNNILQIKSNKVKFNSIPYVFTNKDIIEYYNITLQSEGDDTNDILYYLDMVRN